MNELSHPLLSVIVPAYNVEKYINESIDSILAQDYPALEIIVINDGSTDGTSRMLDKYREDKRFVIIEKENEGPGVARNRGLDTARGEFITFVDGDDVIAPDTYGPLMEIMKTGEVSIVSFPMIFDWQSPHPGTHRLPDCTIREKADIMLFFLRGKITFSACNKIYRREVLKNVRFPEGVKHEDMGFWDRLLEADWCMRFTELGNYYYRYRPRSITRTSIIYSRAMEFVDPYYSIYLKSLRFDRLRLQRVFYFSSLLQQIERWEVENLTPEEYRKLKDSIEAMAPSSLLTGWAFLAGAIGSTRYRLIREWKKTAKTIK